MSPQSKELPFHLRRGRHRLAAVLHDVPGPRLVVLAHGFTGDKSEHARLFVDLARALARRKISALRFDFMGSGDSSGTFRQVTPNTEIADLNAVLDWAGRRYRQVGLLGLSLGGAVAIATAARRRPGDISALCTWSSLPSFKLWRPTQVSANQDPENVWRVGARFHRAHPRMDVPEAYARLALPKLQIQGDADLPSFREMFSKFYARAPEPKRHLVLPGADHVFTKASDRRQVIAATVAFFVLYLTTPR
jgi:alpha/beta superfamily hydrolase